ncbi:ATP-binding protein [Paractinoplanes maris]|uniref:ATP-binding protein n=1 Tax=Paractinoplanes maris TaxID=1734446 RepID=UPI0034DB6618
MLLGRSAECRRLDEALAAAREGHAGVLVLHGEPGVGKTVYGEWLRTRDRHAEARTELRKAHEIFTATGAQAFADRARRELLASGESAVPDPRRPAVAVLTRIRGQLARSPLSYGGGSNKARLNLRSAVRVDGLAHSD